MAEVLNLAIFDMDGLMLDTEPISAEGWRHAGEKTGFTFTQELFNTLLGRNHADCRALTEAYFGPEFDFEKVYALRTAYVREYIEQHGVPVKKGLFELLALLEEMNIKKCVATSTDKARAEHVLSGAGVLERFDFVLGGDSILNGKPAPEIFLTAAEKAGIKPEYCVVFEDSDAGVAAAHAAGMRVILVPDTEQPKKQTLERATAVCGDLLEAGEVVRNL